MSLIPLGFWSQSGEGQIITTSLIFYYDPAKQASYPGSGTVVNDLSLNTDHSALEGGTGFNPADGGGSFTFDGINDRLFPGYPNTNDIGLKFVNQSFTIEAWIKPATSPSLNQVFFCVNQSGGGGSRFHGRLVSDGTVQMNYFGDDLASPVGQVSFGSWQHIAMRYRSNDHTSTILKNGMQIAQGNNGPLVFVDNFPEAIIAAFGNTEWWKGSIGAIYAYQAALTDAQIASNYNALKSRYGL